MIGQDVLAGHRPERLDQPAVDVAVRLRGKAVHLAVVVIRDRREPSVVEILPRERVRRQRDLHALLRHRIVLVTVHRCVLRSRISGEEVRKRTVLLNDDHDVFDVVADRDATGGGRGGDRCAWRMGADARACLQRERGRAEDGDPEFGLHGAGFSLPRSFDYVRFAHYAQDDNCVALRSLQSASARSRAWIRTSGMAVVSMRAPKRTGPIV